MAKKTAGISGIKPGRIFGPKRDEETGGWRKLHNEELHNLYSSPSIIRMIKSRRMRWAGHVARVGAKRNEFRILMGKPERKRPPETQSRRGGGEWTNLKWALKKDYMEWYVFD
jgi:hypothetical protein